MPQRVEERLRPITPQLAWRVAVLGGIAFVLFGIVFFRLWYLQVLTGQEARRRGASDNRVRKVPHRGAARGHRGPQRRHARARPSAPRSSRWCPSTLPESVRDDADDYRKALAAAENERLHGAGPATTRSARQLRDDGRKITKAEKRERARAAEARRDGRAGPGPGAAADRDRS